MSQLVLELLVSFFVEGFFYLLRKPLLMGISVVLTTIFLFALYQLALGNSE